MKKYRAPLALFLCVFCHATAMEKVCYLNRMPRDILDYIAIFLTCDDETEEQFIARTFAEKQKKDDYYYENAHHEVCMPNLCLAAKNKKKQRISLKEDGARLALFDGSKVYEYKGLAKSGYECCALSPSGTMIAIFHRQFLPGEKYKTAILEILKMGTEDIPEQENGNLIVEKRRKLLRRNYKTSFNDIAFNKQGQHLIAWNLSSTSDVTDKNNYTIFPLKNIDPSEKQVGAPTTNKLQEYFRDKLVCQKYIEGKK